MMVFGAGSLSSIDLNAYYRIVKKHDKQTGLSLRPTFVSDFLEKRPFYRYNWDSIIVKLSELYDLVRNRGQPAKGDSSAGGSQSAFIRQTTKYWVSQTIVFYLLIIIPSSSLGSSG